MISLYKHDFMSRLKRLPLLHVKKPEFLASEYWNWQIGSVNWSWSWETLSPYQRSGKLASVMCVPAFWIYPPLLLPLYSYIPIYWKNICLQVHSSDLLEIKQALLDVTLILMPSTLAPQGFFSTICGPILHLKGILEEAVNQPSSMEFSIGDFVTAC